MQIKRTLLLLFLILNGFLAAISRGDDPSLGQSIQINLRLESFIGRPQWLVIIRDVDDQVNIPYLFDIVRPIDFFMMFTRGHNYTILASTLQFSPYRRFPYTQRRIRNFCHLESDGRIMKGESMIITLQGRLTPYEDTYDCIVSQYADYHFAIAPTNT